MSFPKKCKIYVVRKRKAVFTHLTDLGVGKKKYYILHQFEKNNKYAFPGERYQHSTNIIVFK